MTIGPSSTGLVGSGEDNASKLNARGRSEKRNASVGKRNRSKSKGKGKRSNKMSLVLNALKRELNSAFAMKV